MTATVHRMVPMSRKRVVRTADERPRRAIRRRTSGEGDLSQDPLFRQDWGFEGPVTEDASKVNEVLYRKRKGR